MNPQNLEKPPPADSIREYDVQELQEKLHESERFAHILAHDLRAPLKNINNFAMMIRTDPTSELSDRSNRLLGELQKQISLLVNLVNDLREISKQTLGELEVSDCNLDLILHEIMAHYPEEIRAKNTQITISNLPIIKANPTLMWQLFDNLVRNALHHGAEPLIIQVETIESPEGLIIEFSNSVQIAANVPKGIFDFSKASSAKSTGIGLHICQKIVRLHGGHISALVEENTFTIKICLKEKNHARD